MVSERLMANCLSKAERRPEKHSRPLPRWWAVAGLTLFAATWKLWTPQTEFPQVPLFGWAGSLPASVDWLAFGVLLGSLATLVWNATSRRSWLAFVVSLSVLIILDQHRLQPWAWQLLLMGIFFATFQASGGRQPPGSLESDRRTTRGLTPPARLLRGLTISIYFWSAVSKFDAGFYASHGQTLVEALFQSVSINAANWPPSVKWWLAFSLPLGELLVAVGLSWPRTRQAALIAATALHVGLILALGPLGLGHRPGVLLWNIAFIGHDWLLFGAQASGAASAPRFRIEDTGGLTPPRSPAQLSFRVAVCVTLFACVWPITAGWGLCDHWLAWSVYSTRIERVSVTLTDEGARRLPESTRRLVVDGELRLDRWSLAALDVPVYPQLRFQFGVIEGLRRQYGVINLIEVNVQRASGDGETFERLTIEQFDERSREFWINTRPHIIPSLSHGD